MLGFKITTLRTNIASHYQSLHPTYGHNFILVSILGEASTSNHQHGAGIGSQEGLGQSNSFSIDHIVQLVSERILPQMATSEWNVPPTIVNSNSSAPFQYDAHIRKTDLNDKFDRKKLISKIPKHSRTEAVELLNKIEERSSELSFDSQGIIFIDGVALPQSDAFHFFPLLYRKRIPKGVHGFDDFVTKLQSMGLQNLFNKKKHIEQEVDKKLSNAMTQKNWWVLN